MKNTERFVMERFVTGDVNWRERFKTETVVEETFYLERFDREYLQGNVLWDNVCKDIFC